MCHVCVSTVIAVWVDCVDEGRGTRFIVCFVYVFVLVWGEGRS